MEPTQSQPTEQQAHESRENMARKAGAICLVLIFFVAASITWSYLTDSAASAASTPPAPLTEITPLPDPQAFDGISLAAHGAIVVDETTGHTLYAKNPDAQWPLASLTKIALVLAVSQVLPPDTPITIPYDTGYNSHDSQPLRAGERFKLQDVINFTLAISSNEGADILASAANAAVHQAYPLSPVQDATLWRMNDLVRQLGLTNTYYLNDNGLDESTTLSGAYGTAHDMAALFAYAAAWTPQTFAATTRTSFSVTSIDGDSTTALNTDDALPDLPGIILGKTGYTDLAGGNLAVVLNVQGHIISAVVLGSTENGRFDDMETLIAATREAFGAGT